MAPKKDASSTKPAIKDLAKAVADASGWVKSLGDLNDALQPFLTEELSLDRSQSEVEALIEKKAALEHEIVLRERHLAEVRADSDIAKDERAKRLDADLDDYRRSIESKQRALDALLDDARIQLADLSEAITSKTHASALLDEQIADQRRTLSQLQSDAAAVVAKLQAAAGGRVHVPTQ